MIFLYVCQCVSEMIFDSMDSVAGWFHVLSYGFCTLTANTQQRTEKKHTHTQNGQRNRHSSFFFLYTLMFVHMYINFKSYNNNNFGFDNRILYGGSGEKRKQWKKRTHGSVQSRVYSKVHCDRLQLYKMIVTVEQGRGIVAVIMVVNRLVFFLHFSAPYIHCTLLHET